MRRTFRQRNGEKRDFEGETDFIDGGAIRARKGIYGSHSAPYGTWTMKPKVPTETSV